MLDAAVGPAGFDIRLHLKGNPVQLKDKRVLRISLSDHVGKHEGIGAVPFSIALLNRDRADVFPDGIAVCRQCSAAHS
jgi:hypothetical protein